MIADPIRAWRELKNEHGQRRINWVAVLCFAALAVVTMVMSLKEAGYEYVDFRVHMNIAGDFDFSDLHSITSRLAYPLWHLMVSALYQLGMQLEWAAALVSTLCKCFTYVIVYEMVRVISREKAGRWIPALVSLAVMIVTGIHIRSVSYFVYKGVGSPNVWHNPTQQAVTLAMMMVMPWLAHCWCAFESRLQNGETNILLPWWKVIVLAVLCMGSLACKPTFMQALLPAAFVMFLVELIRHKTEWRYFGQIVLAFVPAAAYFLLQYLYYTGVVVEFTSGVVVSLTPIGAWRTIRNTLMMSAAPLTAIVACYRKGMFKDRQIVLALLMTAFSVLEAMLFHETGQREGHGNFGWAANSSSFYLWVIMAGTFLRSFAADVKNKSVTLLRGAGYAATIGFFVWHVYSGLYYLSYLLTTTNAF